MSSRISSGRRSNGGSFVGSKVSDMVMEEGSAGAPNGYGSRAYCWRDRKYSRRTCLESPHTASSGRKRMDCILLGNLDWGRDAARGDVQIRLFGGADDLVDRFVKLPVEVVIVKEAQAWKSTTAERSC
jgi:hypothetical protein